MANERDDNLTISIGGIQVKGRILTDLDTGTSRWYPYDGPNYDLSSNIYLESKQNADGTYSGWTGSGNVFNELRFRNSQLEAAYSTKEALATAFYSSGTSVGSPTKALNDGRLGQFNNYGASQTVKNLKIPGTVNVSPPQQPNQDQIDAAKAKNAVANPSTIDGTNGTITVGTATGKQRTFENLYYPVDLEKNKQDRIKFSMIEYAPAKINPILGQKTITRNFTKTINGSVTLPIQPSITDSNSVDWSGATLNAIQAKTAGASMTLMNQPNLEMFGRTGVTLLEEALKELATNGSYSNAFKVIMAQEAVGAQNLLSRATGAILNPNLELLFNGPSLRPFAFTFRMSPRDATEAKQVKKIIRFFKQGMAVKTTTEDIF